MLTEQRERRSLLRIAIDDGGPHLARRARLRPNIEKSRSRYAFSAFRDPEKADYLAAGFLHQKTGRPFHFS